MNQFNDNMKNTDKESSNGNEKKIVTSVSDSSIYINIHGPSYKQFKSTCSEGEVSRRKLNYLRNIKNNITTYMQPIDHTSARSTKYNILSEYNNLLNSKGNNSERNERKIEKEISSNTASCSPPTYNILTEYQKSLKLLNKADVIPSAKEIDIDHQTCTSSEYNNNILQDNKNLDFTIEQELKNSNMTKSNIDNIKNINTVDVICSKKEIELNINQQSSSSSNDKTNMLHNHQNSEIPIEQEMKNNINEKDLDNIKNINTTDVISRNKDIEMIMDQKSCSSLNGKTDMLEDQHISEIPIKQELKCYTTENFRVSDNYFDDEHSLFVSAFLIIMAACHYKELKINTTENDVKNINTTDEMIIDQKSYSSLNGKTNMLQDQHNFEIPIKQELKCYTTENFRVSDNYFDDEHSLFISAFLIIMGACHYKELKSNTTENDMDNIKNINTTDVISRNKEIELEIDQKSCSSLNVKTNTLHENQNLDITIKQELKSHTTENVNKEENHASKCEQNRKRCILPDDSIETTNVKKIKLNGKEKELEFIHHEKLEFQCKQIKDKKVTRKRCNDNISPSITKRMKLNDNEKELILTKREYLKYSLNQKRTIRDKNKNKKRKSYFKTNKPLNKIIKEKNSAQCCDMITYQSFINVMGQNKYAKYSLKKNGNKKNNKNKKNSNKDDNIRICITRDENVVVKRLSSHGFDINHCVAAFILCDKDEEKAREALENGSLLK